MHDTEVWLVRHGETDWNVKGILQGHCDIKLNDKGHNQAALAAEYLCTLPLSFNQLYSSDLERATQTASYISQALNHRLPIQTNPSLREHNVGELLQGKTLPDIMKIPELAQQYMQCSADPNLPLPGGGESTSDMYNRCISAIFNDIVPSHVGERIIIVTHGGVLRHIESYVTKNSAAGNAAAVPHQRVSNASISCITMSNNRWKVSFWGKTDHL